MKNKTVTATIEASIPLRKNLDDSGLVLNLGALTLSLGGRNFILDSQETSFDNPMKKGKKFTFETELAVDLDTFPDDGDEESYNYELTEKDLKDKNLKAEFYCGDEDVEEENSFDFDKAKISCTVCVDDKYYKIPNVTFE